MNKTLAATLIATVAGTGSWLSGLARTTWPAHPMIAEFLITIGASIVVLIAWPRMPKRP